MQRFVLPVLAGIGFVVTVGITMRHEGRSTRANVSAPTAVIKGHTAPALQPTSAHRASGVLAASAADPAVPTKSVLPTTPVSDPLPESTRSTLQTLGLNVVLDGSGGVAGISGGGVAMWRSAGLQTTDVVIAIDGRPVAEVLKEPYALDNSSQAAVTTLTVLREGSEVTITATPDS